MGLSQSRWTIAEWRTIPSSASQITLDVKGQDEGNGPYMLTVHSQQKLPCAETRLDLHVEINRE